jgi:hypothetical protein
MVKWIAKSMRPFSIVEDEGFKTLMKTGQPNHYLPKRQTVARDMKQVFNKTCKRVKKNAEGNVNFTEHELNLIKLTRTTMEH